MPVEMLDKNKRCFQKLSYLIFENKWLRNVLIVLGCFLGGFIILCPFLLSKTLFEGNDFLYHYNVFKALDEAFQNKQFFDKVLPTIANDYGYGTGYFYGLLPAMTAVIAKNILNCGYVVALKIVVYFSFSLTALVMFYFAKRVLRDNKKAIFASLMYVTFPYYISNLYVRFAYSEFIAYLFIPLIVWGMYELLYLNNGKAFLVLFISGLTLLMFTHMSTAIWVCLVCLIMIFLNFKKFLKDMRWLLFIIACVVILCLTAYYTVPLFEVYVGDLAYRVSDPTIMCTSAAKVFSCANFPALYYNTYPTSLPFFSIYQFIISAFYFVIVILVFKGLKKTKPNDKSLFIENPLQKDSFNRKLLITFAVLCVFIFLSNTKLAVWWFITPSFFRMIQFPSRLFNLFALLLVFIAPTAYKGIEKPKNKKRSVGIMVGVMVFTTLIYSTLYPTVAYKLVSEETLQTNNVINRGCGDQFEYLLQTCSPDYMRERNNVLFENYNNLDVKDLIQQTDQNQLRFYLVKSDAVENDNLILKIPYDKNLKIVQCSATYLNENMDKYFYDDTVFADWSQEIEFKSYTLGNEEYVSFELKNADSIITVDYSNSEETQKWLDENSFQFKTESGNSSFSNFEKNGHDYKVDVAVLSESVIELPTIFYTGYNVKLTKADGTVQNIEAKVSENGFLQIELFESGILSVEWTGSKYIDVGKWLSVIGFILFVFIVAIILFVPKSFWKKFKLSIRRFCDKNETFMEVLRFLIIGAFATLIDWIGMAIVMYVMQPQIYSGFTQVIVGGSVNPSTWATVLGTGIGALIGMIVSYIFSVKFVFNQKGNSKSVMGFAMFIFLSLIGLGMHMFGMYIGYNLLHYNEWFVKIFMSIVVLIYNYLSKRVIIFNNKRKLRIKSSENKEISREQ